MNSLLIIPYKIINLFILFQCTEISKTKLITTKLNGFLNFSITFFIK